MFHVLQVFDGDGHASFCQILGLKARVLVEIGTDARQVFLPVGPVDGVDTEVSEGAHTIGVSVGESFSVTDGKHARSHSHEGSNVAGIVEVFKLCETVEHLHISFASGNQAQRLSIKLLYTVDDCGKVIHSHVSEIEIPVHLRCPVRLIQVSLAVLSTSGIGHVDGVAGIGELEWQGRANKVPLEPGLWVLAHVGDHKDASAVGPPCVENPKWPDPEHTQLPSILCCHREYVPEHVLELAIFLTEKRSKVWVVFFLCPAVGHFGPTCPGSTHQKTH